MAGLDFSSEATAKPLDFSSGAVGAAPTDPAAAAALADARRRNSTVLPFERSIATGATLNFGDELDARAAQAETAIHGLINKVTGRKPVPYSAKQAYDAVMQVNREAETANRQAHPIQTGVTELAGGLLTPGIGLAGKFVKGATSLGGAALRSAGVGAALGGVAGAGSADGGLIDRAKGAGEGVVVGGLIGGVAPVAARGAVGLIPAISETAQSFGRAMTGSGVSTAARTLTPKAAQSAKDRALAYVADLTARSGKTVDDLDAHPAETMGKPITAAEAIGRGAMYQLGTLGKRSGTTPDALEGMLEARRLDTPNRLTGDIASTLDVHPDAAKGSIDALVTAGQAKAVPLYRAALDRPDAIVNSRLEALAKRPVIRDAIKAAIADARNAGRDPEGEGLTFLDTFAGHDAPTTTTVRASPQMTGDLNAIGNGTRASLGRGPSLLEFIGKQGGIRDFGGELQSMNADTWHKTRPFLSKLIRDTGLSADEMAGRAHEAGYFPEVPHATMAGSDNMHPVTAQHLYDAVQGELAGKARYPREADMGAAERATRRGMLSSTLDELGVPASERDPHKIAGLIASAENDRNMGMAHLEGDPLAMSPNEPVAVTAPTARTWDMVKKAVADQVERHPITNAPLPDSVSPKNRGISAASAALTKELRDSIHGYGDALDHAGDYLSHRSAFERVRGQVFKTQTTAADFAKLWSGFSPSQADAARASIANDFHNLAQNGRLKPQLFNTPSVRAKLTAAFGPEKTQALIDRVEQEAVLAKGNRMTPGTNSTTGEAAFAGDEQDGAQGLIARGVVRGLTGDAHGAVRDLGRTVISGLLAPARGAATPLAEAARNEVGRLLQLKPSELAAELRQFGTRTPKGIIAARAGTVAAATAGGYVPSVVNNP